MKLDLSVQQIGIIIDALDEYRPRAGYVNDTRKALIEKLTNCLHVTEMPPFDDENRREIEARMSRLEKELEDIKKLRSNLVPK